ncbi:hypothetical protein LEP1GSC151_2289 [Leptospira interrogans serovar Grippotyphosa str. LT2186]|uniref:Uncharacterized protein n=3 Tax=Leptospira interrogans TaxID=173 RepID=M6ZV68_LEPIR|nr:hypothetical protein LEP1GSC151_2289 [Leptospira interrogans serovar Grippotyphosa str. LT2186]EMM82288.1 hypothetical protein LEP1GSC037_3848 [Leptospira interrogans str. 2006001854]EMP05675.1 hypothetical protein LEP1GSC124_1745 [Leptospira interrogans serovar Pyrogenes str. 200701872]
MFPLVVCYRKSKIKERKPTLVFSGNIPSEKFEGKNGFS